ncbi:MAG: OPT/YSL family transporter [Gemmatimonadota bacterium]
MREPAAEPSRRHPSVFEPATLAVAVALALLGSIIGVQLLSRVGITPNSSIIGAIMALALARIPLAMFRPFASLDRQNLLQTVISGATFGGANAVFLAAGIPWLVGRPDLVPAMLGGAFLALLVDATLLYKVFNSASFPAGGLWPSGVATAEVILAGDEGGGRARLLAAGGVVGGVGQLLGIPMDVFGVCWIGNVWALAMFAVGLLVRGYAPTVLGVDLGELYVPHGIMIGAGLVALGQIVWAVRDRSGTLPDPQARAGDEREPATPADPDANLDVPPHAFGRALGGGLLAYVVIAAGLAAVGGVWSAMSPGMLAGFVLFAAVAALLSEMVVGLSAMHAGWFPAFATALIFLVVGILLGFPSVPLALLVGFTAATGPAFADMGYDLKAGWILRGRGADMAYERAGRAQQYLAELIGFAVAGVFVLLVHQRYFAADLFPPVDRVFAATIAAGASPELAHSLLVWAVPGALIQLLGGRSRQLGILLATGLLIVNPVAGWTAAASLVVRAVLTRRYGGRAEAPMYVAAGGFIAGSALVGFGVGAWKAR